ncbi:MAG TPA: JAB domain-containing protein [Thermodesulfovibrionales bacterium]|nr:JAB domain-containing protein [Thermodesulfovibrionales bacterium]
MGTLTLSLVHPREVFNPAILTNAASIILAHNHPSGDPMPSEDDLNITKRLKEAGELLGISVLDHIIIGYSYYSTESNKSYPFEDEEGE